jgi:APA family basic amino acid/polyamine antiporter
VREPRRTVPRAILITVSSVSVLYFAVALAAVGAGGTAAMARGDAPLAQVARAMGMPALETAVSAGAVCAMLGVLLSQLLGLSRMVFAMARGGDLPGWLAKVDAVSSSPRRAVVLVGVAAAGAAAFGTLRAVAPAASFAILLYYAVANLAALRMPRAAKLYPDAVPAVGLVGCLVLAASLSWRTAAVGMAVLAAGFVVRAAARALAGRGGGD